MDPIKLLLGPARCGKTFQARIETQNKKTVWIDFKSNICAQRLDQTSILDLHPFIFHEVDDSTEVIVFDDVSFNDLPDLIEHLYAETITINRKGVDKYKVNCPNIIITSEYVGRLHLSESMSRRVEVYSVSLKPVLEKLN